MDFVAKEYQLQLLSYEPVHTIYRDSAIYKLKTSVGTKALKEFHKSELELQFVTTTILKLYKQGACVIRPIRTKNKKLYFHFMNRNFYLIDWFEGRPFDAFVDSDLRLATRSIAKFHQISRKMKWRSIPESRNYKERNWDLLRAEHRLFEKRILKIRERTKSPAREMLLSYTSYFKRQGRDAIQSLSQLKPGPAIVIHRDLTRPNLLVGSDEIRILDFDRCGMGYLARDLSDFLSNTLGWSRSKGITAFQEYLNVNSLTKQDQKITIELMKIPREAYEAARLCLKPNHQADVHLNQYLKSILSSQTAKREFIENLYEKIR